MTTFGEELILGVVGDGKNKTIFNVFSMKNLCNTQHSASTDATPSGNGCGMDKTDKSLTMKTNVISSQGSAIVDALQESRKMVSDAVRDAVEKSIAKQKEFRLTDKSLHNFEYLYVEAPKSEGTVGRISYPQPLPDAFYDRLPKFYTELPAEQKLRELRDAVLQAQFTVTSATMANCRVWDVTDEYACNIMSMFASLSTVGKRSITQTRNSVASIQKRLFEEREQARKEYKKQLREYEDARRRNGNKKNPIVLEEPEKPILPVMDIEPNTTFPNLIKKLWEQKGVPALTTQEEMIETLKANRAEHGEFLTLFLKAYDNARTERSIKTNDEDYNVEFPVLSLLATLTDDQLPQFFNDAPAGLEARINMQLINCENDYRPEDSDAFAKHQAMMKRIQQNLHEKYFFLRRKDNDEQKYTLVLTPEVKVQMDRFLDVKSRMVDATYRCKNAKGVVFRRRVDFKRYLMQLSLHRLHEQLGSWEAALSSCEIVPTLEDANLMLFYINYLIDHTLYVLELYGKTQEEGQEMKKKDLMSILSILGDTFSSAQAKLVLKENGIGERKSYRVINNWLKANLIEETGKLSSERTFRKLGDKERRQRNNLSAKQLKKCKSSVNKRNKK